MSNKEQPAFSRDFWRGFDSLGIYSTEDGPLLSDQEDAGVAGGSNSSDDKNKSEISSETNEQNNDMNLDMGSDIGSTDFGGDTDMGGDLGGGDASGDDSGGGAMGGGTPSEDSDPNENPFKEENGKSLLDSKLAELQSAISDTLQRIYVNPKVDTVVVSEMETLNDSVRNIRETIYAVPTAQSQYKYRLAALSYAQLSKQLITELQAEIKKQ